ncbi:MAG: hypothetical protein KGN02_09725 [bacterium]|nr:hypothetical protein [bacterium]
MSLACGAFAARALLAHAPARLAPDRAQPLVVATAWGSYGALHLLVLVAALALAAIPYLAILRSREPPTLRGTLIASALTLAAGAAWLPLFSSDVYAYAAYGEMARIGLDPYLHAAVSQNPAIAAAQWQWGGSLPICVYGSAFVALARGVMTLLAAAPLVVRLDALRAVAALAFLACGALLYALRDGDARAKRSAAFAFACNPALVWVALEGHNDALMLAVVLTGALLARRRTSAGIALAALGALVKAPALAAAAALAMQRIVTRDRALAAIVGLALGVAVVCAGSLALVHGVRADLAPHGHYAPSVSVQALSPYLAALAALAVIARLRAFDAPLDRWCVGALALWLAIPNPYPWYALWIVPIAVLGSDPRVLAATLAVGAVALLRYLPDAAVTPGPLAAALLGALALAAYAPLFTRAIISRS